MNLIIVILEIYTALPDRIVPNESTPRRGSRTMMKITKKTSPERKEESKKIRTIILVMMNLMMCINLINVALLWRNPVYLNSTFFHGVEATGKSKYAKKEASTSETMSVARSLSFTDKPSIQDSLYEGNKTIEESKEPSITSSLIKENNKSTADNQIETKKNESIATMDMNQSTCK